MNGVFSTEGLRETLRRYESGAVRSSDVIGRIDLICPAALKRLALTMEEGLRKYGLDNWTKGMDIGETMNHLLGHAFEYLAGDRSEDHLGHLAANVFFLMHFETHCECHKSRQRLLQNSKDYAQKQGTGISESR